MSPHFRKEVARLEILYDPLEPIYSHYKLYREPVRSTTNRAILLQWIPILSEALPKESAGI